jgi:hypothetical protein
MITKPAPGLRQRWIRLLIGCLIVFGVVTAAGITSQLLHEHYEPLQKELAILRLRINTYENAESDSEIGPTDFRRLGELEGRLGSISDVEFDDISERLLDLSILPFFLTIVLMLLQLLGRWLWSGNTRVVDN